MIKKIVDVFHKGEANLKDVRSAALCTLAFALFFRIFCSPIQRRNILILVIVLILFRHRTEGSREIVLRLRELSVLPPLKAN